MDKSVGLSLFLSLLSVVFALLLRAFGSPVTAWGDRVLVSSQVIKLKKLRNKHAHLVLSANSGYVLKRSVQYLLWSFAGLGLLISLIAVTSFGTPSEKTGAGVIAYLGGLLLFGFAMSGLGRIGKKYRLKLI